MSRTKEWVGLSPLITVSFQQVLCHDHDCPSSRLYCLTKVISCPKCSNSQCCYLELIKHEFRGKLNLIYHCSMCLEVSHLIHPAWLAGFDRIMAQNSISVDHVIGCYLCSFCFIMSINKLHRGIDLFCPFSELPLAMYSTHKWHLIARIRARRHKLSYETTASPVKWCAANIGPRDALWETAVLNGWQYK